MLCLCHRPCANTLFFRTGHFWNWISFFSSVCFSRCNDYCTRLLREQKSLIVFLSHFSKWRNPIHVFFCLFLLLSYKIFIFAIKFVLVHAQSSFFLNFFFVWNFDLLKLLNVQNLNFRLKEIVEHSKESCLAFFFFWI